jgi:hypothetical protein
VIFRPPLLGSHPGIQQPLCAGPIQLSPAASEAQVTQCRGLHHSRDCILWSGCASPSFAWSANLPNLVGFNS